MHKNYLIIFLLTVCNSEIQINIVTSNYLNKTNIKHQGSDIKQVTDKEIELFKITNDNLNKGVRVEMGKVPDEIFLKDPTVYGKVFEKYNWPDVRRKLIVRKITIVEFIKEDVVLMRKEHINNSTVTVASKTDIAVALTNTATAIWKKPGLPNDVICLKVFIDFGYGNVQHQIAWKDPNATTFEMVLEKSKGVIDIQSGQSVITKLLAEKIILLVEIELDAHLVGNIVANYAHEYGKYHLWSPTIGNIMRAAKLKNEITTKFLLEIRYYGNARLEVVDKETGKEIITKGKRQKRKRKQKLYFN